MKSATLIILIALLVFVQGPSELFASRGYTPSKKPAYSDKTSVHLLAERNTAFALDLYAKLREQEGNLFFSPFSISAALAMTLAGARTETEEEMARILRLGWERRNLHPTLTKLMEEIEGGAKRGDYSLNIANALWGQKGFPFLPDFLDVMKVHYGSGIREVDFMQDAEQARRLINQWVEEKTNKKIQDLLAKDVLTEETRLVLVNAIYFKGNWALPFDKKLTTEAAFYSDAGETLAQLMLKAGSFRYREGDGFQAVELPYVEEGLSMLILLPEGKGDLPQLESKMTPENLATWQGEMTQEQGRVFLPRFKVTCEFKLNKTLESLGMSRAFSPNPGVADFSGIANLPPPRDLHIQAVVHKALVEVSEEGTEASAATGVVVGGTTSIKPPPKNFTFRADHPFLFAIRHKATGSILFLGRVLNPVA